MFFLDWFLLNNHYLSIIGIFVILSVAYLFSAHRKAIKFRLIFIALLLQSVLGLFIIKTAVGREIFAAISRGVESLYKLADHGCSFVFGNLAHADGPWGFIFAIKVLPIVIFFGALMSLLYHIGLVQLLVKGIAFTIRPLLGTSGAETLSVAANSMLGQTEAPLLIKNYFARMTNSEIMTVMVSGMAHLSGSILAAYGMMGVPVIHMLSASIMAIPGAILISKILMPEVDSPETMGGQDVKMPRESKNVLDAVSTGTSDGMKLAANIAAMLVAFISLIALADAVLAGVFGITLNDVFAKLFFGVAYLIGISPVDCKAAGALLGQKLVINEFVAYSSMIKASLSDRSVAILTYALAGFANFSSIGIQIGGLGAICPNKRETLTKLGMRALLGGTLTNLLNAAIASLFM
jgi:CNT family concentrative nucleoside transporter